MYDVCRVVTKLVGAGRARPALTKGEKPKSDQQKKNITDLHISSQIG